MDLCPDCVASGEDPPEGRDGKSPVCHWHRKARRQHQDRQRSRALRAARRGEPKPTQEPYEPKALDFLIGGMKDRRISADDVNYLEDLIGAVRRSKNDLDTAITNRTRLDPKVIVNLSRDLGILLTELNTFLWPEGPPPVRKRRRLKDRYRT